MVNEDKVRLMTKLAIYEEKKCKDSIPSGEYYKGDYIAKHLIIGFFAGTLAFLCIAFLWVGSRGDGIIEEIVSLDIVKLLSSVAVAYGVFIVAYLIVCYIVACVRYKKGMRNLKILDKGLKRLEKVYKDEEGDTRNIRF